MLGGWVIIIIERENVTGDQGKRKLETKKKQGDGEQEGKQRMQRTTATDKDDIIEIYLPNLLQRSRPPFPLLLSSP